MSKFSRVWSRFYQRIRTDIFEFAAEMGFGGEINKLGGLSWQQADFLQAVQVATHGFPAPSYPHITKRATANLGKRWLACKSGQGPGKTTASTVAGTWRTLQEPGALTMVSAPTMAQCRDVWLTELRRVLDRANPILSEVIDPTRSRVCFKGDEDWAINFCTSNKTESSQGRHHPKMTWLNEEASGIPRALCVQVEGTLSNLEGEGMNGMFINIGNPNTRDCYFFDCFNSDRGNWWTYTMNAEESPPYIVSQERNRLLSEKYGKDSDIYRVRVRGEFPRANPNCVISSEDLMECTQTNSFTSMRAELYVRPEMRKQLGIDFARFGNDESCIVARFGYAVLKMETFVKTDPSAVVARAIRMMKELGWAQPDVTIVADAGGLGQGIMHRLHETRCRVMEFHNGGTSHKDEYGDKITEAAFDFADKVNRRWVTIPNDNRLIMQLSTRQYHVHDVRGVAKIKLESKEKYVERMRRESGSSETVSSPDRGDAILMAFYDEIDVVGQFASKR